MRKSVVFPETEGPRSATSAPDGNDSDTGCRAAVEPNCLEISSISMCKCILLVSVRCGKLVGVPDFQGGFQKERDKGQQGEDSGKAERRDREVFLILHLDRGRHRRGLAPDLARRDRQRAEITTAIVEY